MDKIYSNVLHCVVKSKGVPGPAHQFIYRAKNSSVGHRNVITAKFFYFVLWKVIPLSLNYLAYAVWTVSRINRSLYVQIHSNTAQMSISLHLRRKIICPFLSAFDFPCSLPGLPWLVVSGFGLEFRAVLHEYINHSYICCLVFRPEDVKNCLSLQM